MKTEAEIHAERVSEAKEILGRVMPFLSSLEPREANFVNQMAGRTRRFGSKMRVSVKQIGWLRDIHEKVMEREDWSET